MPVFIYGQTGGEIDWLKAYSDFYDTHTATSGTPKISIDFEASGEGIYIVASGGFNDYGYTYLRSVDSTGTESARTSLSTDQYFRISRNAGGYTSASAVSFLVARPNGDMFDVFILPRPDNGLPQLVYTQVAGVKVEVSGGWTSNIIKLAV